MMKKMAPSIAAAISESIKAAIASAAYDRSTWTRICVGIDTSAASQITNVRSSSAGPASTSGFRDAYYTSNQREEPFHFWYDCDDPSVWAAGSDFLDGPDHAEKS